MVMAVKLCILYEMGAVHGEWQHYYYIKHDSDDWFLNSPVEIYIAIDLHVTD